MIGVHGTPVPDDADFRDLREVKRAALASAHSLRKQALDLQLAAEEYGYTYSFEWCGVPVVRLPDDIMIFQEIVWSVRPSFIIESGIARGGGLLLSASLMEMAGLHPRVLGIDIQILPHSYEAVRDSRYSAMIEMLEADSIGAVSVHEVRTFVERSPAGPGVLVLDSNHTHQHVLEELRRLAGQMPVGSIVIVADTLVEELPEHSYPDRPWDRGDNPMTAVRDFLTESDDFELATRWARRGLVTENRDGVLVKVS